MATDLKGKVVLITGASTGIGAAAARAFAGVGARVVVHYNASREPAQQVVADIKGAGGQAVAVGGDVMTEADVKRIVAESLAAFGGRLDILINNAGGMLGRIKIEDYTVEHINAC
jgi:3-oxoacyl-[acyl-carrier protein] reductase